MNLNILEYSIEVAKHFWRNTKEKKLNEPKNIPDIFIIGLLLTRNDDQEVNRNNRPKQKKNKKETKNALRARHI